MPDILKVFHRYKVPVFLSTKSDLILRDFELIKKLSQVTTIDIAVSISCFDDKNARIFEPGASAPSKRIEAISKFTPFCRSVSVLNMSVMPYISDSYEELEEMFALSKKMKINNLVSYPLHLRSAKVKNLIFELVWKHFPDIATKFVSLYKNFSSPNKEYGASLYEKIFALRKKYELYDYFVPLKDEKIGEQLNLF